jgi:phosphoglycerate dehydrogenase-like enzyme
VHTVSAGIDHLAALFADRPNIILTHSAGVTAIPIAEFVVGCLLQHCKRVAELADLQRERRFVQLTLRELGDMRVVLLGLGAIGSEVARRLAPLRLPGGWGPAGSLAADSSRCDPSLRIPGFGAVLQGRRCPNSGGTPNPRHRAGGERRGIGRACRGERAGERGPGRLVDEAALLAAVSAGRPVAAYLDAFVEEPLPDGSPLWTAPGVHVSPHLSWSSSHLARRTSDLFAGQLRRWLAGEPLRNRADPGAGY